MSTLSHSGTGDVPNKAGIHCLVWSATTTADILAVIPKAIEMGYDGIEIPVLAPGLLDIPKVRAALDDVGLLCTTSTALPPGIALIDEATTSDAVEFLTGVIRDTAELGAPLVCGPMAAPIGEQRGRGSTPEEWASCVTGLREAGKVATDLGIDLAFEPLNRFETFVVNTTADGIRLCEEVNEPSVGLLLDTFHMNIEEQSLPAAIRAAAPHLKHFHCSENDRGTVGSGHVPWADVFGALKDIDYRGWLTVESFGGSVPEIAAATSIWRPLASSQDALARDSLRFTKQAIHGVSAP